VWREVDGKVGREERGKGGRRRTAGRRDEGGEIRQEACGRGASRIPVNWNVKKVFNRKQP